MSALAYLRESWLSTITERTESAGTTSSSSSEGRSSSSSSTMTGEELDAETMAAIWEDVLVRTFIWAIRNPNEDPWKVIRRLSSEWRSVDSARAHFVRFRSDESIAEKTLLNQLFPTHRFGFIDLSKEKEEDRRVASRESLQLVEGEFPGLASLLVEKVDEDSVKVTPKKFYATLISVDDDVIVQVSRLKNAECVSPAPSSVAPEDPTHMSHQHSPRQRTESTRF